MFHKSVEEILAQLESTDLVLDVGGWACPFNRAQWILDSEPYETRGYYKRLGGPPYQGGETEWFSSDTWVQRDICDRVAWPFRDKQFDFVICSHTLEDIRDPLWVCSELIRVGKRGYIEVPSRKWETCRGIERPNMVGMSHHRWLVEISENKISFLQKYHAIHTHWRFSLPTSYLRSLRPQETVQWLLWNDSFQYEEKTIHGTSDQERSLEQYVQSVLPNSRMRLQIDQLIRNFSALLLTANNRYIRSGLRRFKSWILKRFRK